VVKIPFDRAVQWAAKLRKLEREEKGMGSVADRIVRLLSSVLIFAIAMAVAVAANAQQEAITAAVIGETIQKVGFRAMIQKQAIMYNLAGYARNNPDGTVGVRLQGDEDRIAKTLESISAGNRRSSKANIIGEAPAALDSNLKTFTVFSWTSTIRNILNPYDLVFHLRPTNNDISQKRQRRFGTRSRRAP
jgi:acylphosphatase